MQVTRAASGRLIELPSWLLWTAIGLVAAVALAWGYLVDMEPVPARPADLTTRVGTEWYRTLPEDPGLATDAYVARIPAEVRARGEAYSDSRLRAWVNCLAALVLASTLVLATGLASRIQTAAKRRAWAFLADFATAVVYFVALCTLTLPAEIYADFVRPHRFGFSDQRFSAWLQDTLIDWGVLTILYIVGVLAMYAFIRRRPAQWIAMAIGVYVLRRAPYAFVVPVWIEPLTNDFRPLPDGPQKEQILALAGANGIDDAAVATSDASKQTRVLNAHVSGYGTSARISVDDNTLRATSDPMPRFVVGHEIGHFVLKHQLVFVVTDTAIFAVSISLIAVGCRVLLGGFAGRWGISSLGDIASLPLVRGLFLLCGFASQPMSNSISRILEHQADLFGLNASWEPHGMAEFMIHDADRARLQPGSLEYALFYDHPSDIERVGVAMQWRAENGKLLRHELPVAP